MLNGQLRSAVIILIVTALKFSTAQAQVERPCQTPAGGILTERLSAKQLETWRKIERIVFAVDTDGRFLHPVLPALWECVEASGHAVYLEISEDTVSSSAGVFRLEKFDPTGQHHLAIIKLRPRVIDQAIVGPEAQRPDGLIPFEGLVKEERYAEVLGHELAHAADTLLDPEMARQVEQFIEQTNELLLSPRRRRDVAFFARAEMDQRIKNRDSLLQRLESYAETMETQVWLELRASQRARKGP